METKTIRAIEDEEIIAAMPQTVKVRNHLIRNGSITSQEAWRLYGITRLSSVIEKLRKRKYPLMDIETQMVYYTEYGVNKSYGKYIYRGIKGENVS